MIEDHIKYEVEMFPGTRADATFRDHIILEYKPGVKDIRGLQSGFMQLAKTLLELPNHKAVLILDKAKISKDRLDGEWASLQELYHPSILSRFSMVVFSSDSIVGEFGEVSKEEMMAISIAREKLGEQVQQRKKSPDAYYEVLRVLMIQWIRNEGPLKHNALKKLTGFSYPTISGVLDKLGSVIIRHSNKSVELKAFPKDEWFKLIAISDEIRKPMAYFSHRSRPMEMIIDRLVEMEDKDIALGGITGARHYFPGIDLMGIHRIDMSIHNGTPDRINKLIRTLDPGLKQIMNNESPQLVVHNIYRPESLFKEGSNGIQMADEVECLLDLHESHLEEQAMEFLDYLKSTR